jgi:hypothetical protein
MNINLKTGFPRKNPLTSSNTPTILLTGTPGETKLLTKPSQKINLSFSPSVTPPVTGGNHHTITIEKPLYISTYNLLPIINMGISDTLEPIRLFLHIAPFF